AGSQVPARAARALARDAFDPGTGEGGICHPPPPSFHVNRAFRSDTRSDRSPPPPRHEAPASADAPRVAAAPAGARGGRARCDVPAREDRLPELHRPGVPGAPADEVGRAPELPRPLARLALP